MTDKQGPKLRVVKNDGSITSIGYGVSEKTLEKMLQHLHQNDVLFDYNVPKEWRDPARNGLQEFLVNAYAPKNFEIIGEDMVRKYIQVYDFVALNRNDPAFVYDFYMRPGMKGVIQKVDLKEEKRPLTVLWESCDKFPKEQQLWHNGDNLSILYPEILTGAKKMSKVELLAAARPGMLVEPVQIVFKYEWYVPVGAKGIVTSIDKSNKCPIRVVFGNTAGYIPPTHNDGTISCGYSTLKILRENTFDMQELMERLHA